MAIHSDDNWLQRSYFTWAEPHYRRIPPRTRAEVERIDRWLYSRRGAPVWFCLAMAVVATELGLESFGLPTLLAIAFSIVFWIAIPLTVLGYGYSPNGSPGAGPCASA